MECIRFQCRCLSLLIFFVLVLPFICCVTLTTDHRSPPVFHGGDSHHPAPFELYTVHVAKPRGLDFATSEERNAWYESFLPSPMLPSGEPRMECSFEMVSGFAAWLSPDEVKAMESIDGFQAAYPDRPLADHTTYTPEFLGLRRGLWRKTNKGKGMVIAVFDNGIRPTHLSFSDEGMDPPPNNPKRECDFVEKKYCNNKIVIAKSYDKTFHPEPSDTISGHGTLTASVAGGRPFKVEHASRFYYNGTAAGAAPNAYLAIYAVYSIGPHLISATENAIKNGVHVISISKGFALETLLGDSIAKAAFLAIRHGIVVCCSAGNSGMVELENVAPWILTVGASTTDRAFKVSLQLSNGAEIEGQTAYWPYLLPSSPVPLIDLGTCDASAINGADVSGKIALCTYDPSVSPVDLVDNLHGAWAVVLMNTRQLGSNVFLHRPRNTESRRQTDLLLGPPPIVVVRHTDATTLLSYVIFSPNVNMRIIWKETIYGARPHPAVGDFSSRGPSLVNNGILKPDILGPGVDILASAGNTSGFRVVSGTSFATPHLAGIVAMLKSSHPDWSPAAIKSAIMTSSDIVDRSGNWITDETGRPADLFAMGAGHVNPQRADDPGLIYDLTPEDYFPYLCGLNYTTAQVFQVTGVDGVSCDEIGEITGEELNYPSISVTLQSSHSRTIWRTVTNVGPGNSIYTSRVDVPAADVHVVVYPHKLRFKDGNRVLNYSVTFTARNLEEGHHEGQLWWESELSSSSNLYSVRSPLSITVRV